MATVHDIATLALQELGVLAAGETMAAGDANLALTKFNDWVDQMKAERLTIYTVTRSTFTIVASQASYTVGTGGNVNIDRPVYLDSVRFQDSSLTKPVEFSMYPFTDDDWSRVRIKTLTSTLPNSYYYNPTFPTGTLSLYPIPTSSTLQGVVYAPAAIPEFATLDTSVSLPPGYRRMLVKNLALELAPSFERQPEPALVLQAEQSMTIVKRANAHLVELRMPAAACIGSNGRASSYSIRTD